ncbi:MAG: hypothetical protein DRH30_02600 [Deltaproteobacteria bacterium]|nr:MAG: hypothetical protein DRH30_02600 [Deltaproteobacteria bacterium]
MSYKNKIGPGIDISHYGAPYAQMLGLGNSGDGLGMLYRYGAGLGWAPGAGETPADDPRIASQFAKIKVSFKVRNLSSGKSLDAANAIYRAARAAFAGDTVKKIGTNGWAGDGRVGVIVTLARDTRYGEIRAKGKGIETLNPIKAVSNGGSLYDARTQKLSGSLVTPAQIEADPAALTIDTGPEAEESVDEGGFFAAKVGFFPVWLLGLLGVGLTGGAVYAMTRKKKPAASPVTANRRRRRSSRRRRSR